MAPLETEHTGQTNTDLKAADPNEPLEEDWRFLREFLEYDIEAGFKMQSFASIEEFDRCWAEATTADERRLCIRIAERERERAKIMWQLNREKMNRGSKEWRATIALDPRPSREVAEYFGVSQSTVCNYRRAFGVKSWRRGRPRSDRYRPHAADPYLSA